MKICHIAPFAPSRCGLYEACRDMLRADFESGNDVLFVDCGISLNGKHEDGKVGQIDNRAGFKLETVDPERIQEADIIILHSGCPDIWTVKTQAPFIWVIHGRPYNCFKTENDGKGQSFSLYHSLGKWKRTKKMLYFWDEFSPYWNQIIPEDKLLCLENPVVDQKRFNSNIKPYETITKKGEYNFLICDSDREDIGLYEMTTGIIDFAKRNKQLNVKFHFFGLDFPLSNSWNIVLGKLNDLGFLGDRIGRVSNIESVYTAMDCLISPNRITVRTIAEAISCGLPVIAQNGCGNADLTCDFSNVNDTVFTIKKMIEKLKNKEISKKYILEKADNFSMERYSKVMNNVYKEVLNP